MRKFEGNLFSTREYMLPFGGPLPAGQTRVFSTAVQLPFRGRRIFIPGTIASFVQIDDLTVGNDSQFVATGSVPGVVFAETAYDVALNLDLAWTLKSINFFVRNIGPMDLEFRAAIAGIVYERSLDTVPWSIDAQMEKDVLRNIWMRVIEPAALRETTKDDLVSEMQDGSPWGRALCEMQKAAAF